MPSLITTPRLQRLWNDAQVYPEWATTRLWEYLFNHVFFKDDQYVTSSQRPPNLDDSLRRIDIVVETINDTATEINTLLVVEAKRASATLTDITQVEGQAVTAAYAHSIHHGKKPLWAMTLVGSRTRLWCLDPNSDFLVPFIPPAPGLGQSGKHHYLELNTDGRDILDALNYIKRNPIPPAFLMKKTPSPPPAGSTPPRGGQGLVYGMGGTGGGQFLHGTPGTLPWGASPGYGGSQGAPYQTAAAGRPGRPQPGSGGGRSGGGTVRKIEVRVVKRKFRQGSSVSELFTFTKEDGTDIPPSCEIDWKVVQRADGSIVWVYRHEINGAVYWTRNLG